MPRDPATATANCFTEAVRSGTSVVFLRNISPVPLPLWLPTRLHRRFRGALAAVDRFVYERIDERLVDPDGYDDILGELVRAYGDRARQIAAGTARPGHHPVLRRLRDHRDRDGLDVAAAQPEPGGGGPPPRRTGQVLGGRAPDPGDLKALTYTNQVVQESMRMYPPVYTLTRTAAADDQVCGHQVRRR